MNALARAPRMARREARAWSRTFFAGATVAVGLSLVGGRPAAAQDYAFTISTAQVWTDTGIDLRLGESLTISAEAEERKDGARCDPAAAVSAAAARTLPMPAVSGGALIARLGETDPPVAVEAGRPLSVPRDGRLFVGVNVPDTLPCQGNFAVKVRLSPPESAGSPSPSSPSGGATAAQTSGGGGKDVEDIKGALKNAAQTWLSGQFGGATKPGAQPAPGSSPATPTADSVEAAATSASAPTLTLSDAPLEPALRSRFDALPRRVNDQFQNQGDMVNFVIVGSLQHVQEALTAADWHVADREVKESVVKAVLETYAGQAYLTMPMSELYLFGRVQDYGYQQAEPYAVVASRHHFRIWKAPFEWNGQEVWIGAGTHDIGFERDQRNGKVTHKIDPAVDGERDHIGATLQKAGKVRSLRYHLPPNPVQDARNATGGGYHSDGRILVIELQ